MRLKTEIVIPSDDHIGTVIFFHGSCETGDNFMESIRLLLDRDMEHPNIKFVFPTAPVQPYTPLFGEPSNVWFDRESVSIEAREITDNLQVVYDEVEELIEDEIEDGIPPEKIIVGGFSMGGALALHTGYHVNTDLAGVFALSSFLNRGSIVYKTVKKKISENSKLPELLMFHGDKDTLVPLAWGQETFSKLTRFGAKGEFVVLKDNLHELKKKELNILEEWIEKKLIQPEDIQNKL